MPEIEHAVAEPLYLHDVTFELPGTALEAVRKETLNLYQYFFGTICHGLRFRVHDINSTIPVNEIISSLKKPRPVNIQEEYTNNIKSLYGEIVNFVSKANDKMSSKQNNAAFELRSAGRNMLESIKSTQHLHKNLTKYQNDDNPIVREEYNKIRYRLGSILRSLSEMQKDAEEDRAIMPTIEALKLSELDADNLFLKNIDQHIREKNITGIMATSLMNDNTYAGNIAENLIEIASILFKSQNTEMHDIEQSLMLDEEEQADAVAIRKYKENKGVQ